MAELLYLSGLVVTTVLACNFYGVVASQLAPWCQLDAAVLRFICFVVLLSAGLLLVHQALRRVAPSILRERFQHWILQIVGLVLGGIRGVWWAGLVLLLMLSLGMPYLTTSIKERSMLGPALADWARQSFQAVAEWSPGRHAGDVMPSIRIGDPKLPLPPELQPSPKK